MRRLVLLSVLVALLETAPRAFADTARGDSLDVRWSPLGVTALAVVGLTGGVRTVLALRLRRAT